MYRFFYSVVILFFCVIASANTEIPQQLTNLSNDINQAVIVSVNNPSDIYASVSGWEKQNGVWSEVIKPFDAVIGRNGLAPAGEKREGDGWTPSGTFKLYRSFGYEPSVNTGLNYQQVHENDFWIDDPQSNQYNQWVNDVADVKSFEILRREDHLYKYVIVIEYNTDPIIPGYGSAIFFHLWRDANHPTAGCVAMEEENMLELLAWLDQRQNPVVILH